MPEKLTGIRWFRFARFLCRVFCKLCFRLSYIATENVPEDGCVLLISNHQSFLDPMLCGIRLRRRVTFLARDTLFKHWLFGRSISSVGTIPVRRGEGDLSAMKMVIKRLREGGCVCLFPEGTRTQDGMIAPFRGGFRLLSHRGRAAVVPVVIDGAFDCWPRHKKIFSPGAKIIVRYGQSIPAEKMEEMSNDELLDLITDMMRKMQNECRVEQGKKPYDYR